MNNNQNTVKKHTPTIFEFFNILQLEWICADLRSRIYDRDKDKMYWEFVKQGKKAKIENIASKNNLPTIFDDPQMKEEFAKKIYKEKGFPDFLYKDDAQRAQQEFFDRQNYFAKNIDIRCEIEGEIIVCKIISFEPYQNILRAKRLDLNNVVVLQVNECSRIM